MLQRPCRPPLALILLLAGLPAVSAPSQTTTLASVNPDGNSGDNASFSPSISANGRFVVFSSLADNLVIADTNATSDVFLFDRNTNQVTRVSVDSAGHQANGTSGFSAPPSASRDARVTAFATQATNLDNTPLGGVFVRDRLLHSTARVSVSSAGLASVGNWPSLSANARFVAFDSYASDLVEEDTNRTSDVFVHDRQTGATVCITRAPDGQPGNGPSFSPSTSATGRFVAFGSNATNLVPADTNGVTDGFVHDLHSGLTTRITVDSLGNQANAASSPTVIDATGRLLAFESLASTLVPGDTNQICDIFVHDTHTAETRRVSVDSDGNQAIVGSSTEYAGSSNPSLSASGRFVAFHSWAPNLVADDTNTCYELFKEFSCSDIFVHDLYTGDTTRVSLDWAGAQANAGSLEPVLSGSGRLVVFTSEANLAPNALLYPVNVFVRDRAPCRAGTVNRGAGGPSNVLTVNGATRQVVVARNSPISVALAASPAGPPLASYVLWVWLGGGNVQRRLLFGSTVLGCTVNPTPFDSSVFPAPVRCARSPAAPPAACIGIREVRSAPSAAPWILTYSQGLGGPATFTLQGLVADAGASNELHVGITNAVSVVVP